MSKREAERVRPEPGREGGTGTARINMTIPDELHRAAKSRAAQLGTTLTDFVERAIRECVESTKGSET
jgi:predicted HicB family RNase H-like nuclease